MGEPARVPDPEAFPRVPAYAWAWLQRSRPVLQAAALRLAGTAPTPTFVDDLRAKIGTDPFTRAMLADVIVEVAFSGRVPPRRPAGVSWDRGLIWWAALLAGTTPEAYDTPAPAPPQRSLFDEPAEPPHEPASRERAALAAALRQLIDNAEGDAVPVSALRQLLAALESRSDA